MLLIEKFLSFLIESSYEQLVRPTFPTRDCNILDVILTNMPSLFGVVNADTPLGTSDHSSVTFELVLDSRCCCIGPRSTEELVPVPNVKYKWHQGDYDAISEYLGNIDWLSFIFCNPSAPLMWDAFASILHAAVDMYVPRYPQFSKNKRSTCHGYRTREISRCVAKKRRLWRKLKLNPCNTGTSARYRDCTHQLNHQISLEERIVDASNLGSFFRFVNKRIINKTGITAVTDPSGVTLFDGQQIADAFNAYFLSVGVHSNSLSPHFPSYTAPIIDSIEFNEQDVIAAINKLKSNLSAGPDGLPRLLFKKIKHAIATPLTLIFKQLLSVACVPEVWKSAVIIPAQKRALPVFCLITGLSPLHVSLENCLW